MSTDWSTRTTLVLLGALALALAAGMLALEALLGGPQPVLRAAAVLLLAVGVATLAEIARHGPDDGESP